MKIQVKLPSNCESKSMSCLCHNRQASTYLGQGTLRLRDFRYEFMSYKLLGQQHSTKGISFYQNVISLFMCIDIHLLSISFNNLHCISPDDVTWKQCCESQKILCMHFSFFFSLSHKDSSCYFLLAFCTIYFFLQKKKNMFTFTSYSMVKVLSFFRIWKTKMTLFKEAFWNRFLRTCCKTCAMYLFHFFYF